MSPRYVRAGGVAVDLGGSSGPAAYVRPTDWLTLPTVLSSDQKFVGLYAVYNNESNFVAVNCAGAYTVDWGDGTAAENIATGVQANHNYVYSALGSGTLSSRGYRQAIVTITPQSGQNLTKVDLYIKHNQSGLASTYATGWLDIRMAGTLVSTLTIGSSGATVRHRMLEQFEYIGTSAITTCANKFESCSSLRSIIGTDWTASSTLFNTMFGNCSSLQTIPLINTVAGTGPAAFNSMFNGCVSLQTIPLINTAAGTNFQMMFSACSSLQTIPLINTAAGTNFTQMFSTCSSLQTIPLLNTAAGTDFSSMFASCSSLQTIPLLNTAAGTNFTSMFQFCPTLRVGTLAGTNRPISYVNCLLGPAALDAIYTALGAANLLSLNAASVETSVADWSTNVVNCAVAQNGGSGVDGTKVARMTSIASGIMTAAVTTRVAVSALTQYTFLAKVRPSVAGRASRVAVAWYDAGGALLSTDTGTGFTSNGAFFLQTAVTATSPSSAATASLILSVTTTSASEVHDWDMMGFYLGSVTSWSPGGPNAITVTGNWGTTADTPSIATAKGWTVTGS